MARTEDTSGLCWLDTRDAVEILGVILGADLCVCHKCAPDEELPDALDELLEMYIKYPPVSISMDTDCTGGVHSV